MIWKYRYTILSIVFCAYMLCYLDRMVMATAIPFIAQDFHLSPITIGGVLSAFFVGYALMQIPGGLLTDRFGPRIVLTGSIAWFSVMTAISGIAPGLTTLWIVRVLFGFGEGPFPSAAAKAVANWFPDREVGRANGLQLGSTGLGATIAPPLAVALIAHFGWRSVFYALFIPGLLLTLLVWRYVRDSPLQSQRVLPKELTEFEHPPHAARATKANFTESLRNPAVLWCAFSLFLINVVSWGLLNWLPTYLLQARGFGADKMGVFAAITNLAGALGFPLGGYLCDKYFSHKMRVLVIVGLLLSALFTYLAAVAPSGEWAVFYFVLLFLSMNAASTAIFTLPLVLVPKTRIGGAFGIVNTIGQLAGILSPLLIGYVLEVTHNNFQIALNCMVGALLLALYPASRMRQPCASQETIERLA